MSAPLLAIRGLRAAYGKIEALKGVDIEINAGEIVALIGANGAGKSTLMMTIFGRPRARAGQILYEGRDITDVPTHEIARLRIAQSPEGRRIFPRMSVAENLQMGADATETGEAEKESALERVFALFPRLKERMSQRGGTLSGGEQQMLAIGRALMTNPRLLILDEATEGLAPLIREEIWNCLSMLKARGQSVLVIDKNVEHLSRIDDRHFIIERGRAVWSGTSEQLIAKPDLQHRYLGI